MSKSIHMTVKQACRNNREQHGGVEYQRAVFEDDITEVGKKMWLKRQAKEERALNRLHSKSLDQSED